jgi:transposase-like protein
VHALIATGVDADGHRQVLGIQVTTSEDGAGWLAFFRDLTERLPSTASVTMLVSMRQQPPSAGGTSGDARLG